MSISGGPGDAPAAAPPTCYRHHDRETYVRCTRCDRPICPDCMHSAAVGFQCPECVGEGRRTAVTPRTTLGGRVGAHAGLVTRVLIAANVLVFLLELGRRELVDRYGMLPVAVADGEYYRLLTAAFLHGGVLHIAFNMMALYIVGTQLEALFGASRYLAIYLVSALGGSTFAYLLAPTFTRSVGASGAIFGLFGALFVVARRFSFDTSAIAGVILVNLAITFLLPTIEWRAHVGGLVTGAVVAAALAYAPRRQRTLVAVVAPAAIAVLLAVVIASRTSALTG